VKCWLGVELLRGWNAAACSARLSQSGKNVGSFTVAQHRNLSEVATCLCRRTWCLKYSAFTEKLPTRAFLVALEEDEEIEAQLSQGVHVRTSLAGCFHERDYSQECSEGSTRLGWAGHVTWHAIIPHEQNGPQNPKQHAIAGCRCPSSTRP